jgi:hypothetical protein
MRRVKIKTLGIAYEESGAGDPLLLIHAGLCADWFANLMDEPALAGACRRRLTSGCAASAGRDTAHISRPPWRPAPSSGRSSPRCGHRQNPRELAERLAALFRGGI